MPQTIRASVETPPLRAMPKWVQSQFDGGFPKRKKWHRSSHYLCNDWKAQWIMCAQNLLFTGQWDWLLAVGWLFPIKLGFGRNKRQFGGNNGGAAKNWGEGWWRARALWPGKVERGLQLEQLKHIGGGGGEASKRLLEKLTHSTDSTPSRGRNSKVKVLETRWGKSIFAGWIGLAFG